MYCNKKIRSLICSLVVVLSISGCFISSATASGTSLPGSILAADGSVVTGEERQAIITLVSFFEACNARSADKTRKVNLTLQTSSDQVIADRFFAAKNYILHDVNLVALTPNKISVNMLYSCEVNISNTIGKNINHSQTFVDIGYVSPGEWKIIGAKSNPGINIFDLIQAEDKAALRYGTGDLSKWIGIPGRRYDFLVWYNNSRDIQRQIIKGWNGKALNSAIASQTDSLQVILNTYPVGEDTKFAKDVLFALTTYKNALNMVISSTLFINSMTANRDANFNGTLADGLAGQRLQANIRSMAPDYYDYLDTKIRLEEPSIVQDSNSSWKASIAQKVLLQFLDESLTRLNGTF